MRARNLKPGIYKNESLAQMGYEAFRLFTGLWCMADRQGRLKDEPGKIEAELFPFKFQRLNTDKIMDELAHGEDPFIIRYEIKSQRYVQIVNFLDHQRPHPKEIPSTIPPCRKKLSPRYEQDTTQDTPNPSLPSLSSLSSDVQGLLNPHSKTPSALERRSAVTPFWHELIRHINDAWTAKKRGAKYLWQGKDFANLKRALKVYQPWDLMALWDAFISSQDEFAIKQGYSVPEFVRQISRLVDGNWKAAAHRYMEKLLPADAEAISKINGLVAAGLVGKDIK